MPLESYLKSQHCARNIHAKCRFHKHKMPKYQPTYNTKNCDDNYGDKALRGINKHIHTLTHPLNGPLSGTTQVSQYQKGKTNLDFTEARDSQR